MHYKCDQFEMYPFRERTAGRNQKDAAQSAGGQGTCTGKTTVGIYEGYAIAYPVEKCYTCLDGIKRHRFYERT